MSDRLPAATSSRRVTLAEAQATSPMIKIFGADGGRVGIPAFFGIPGFGITTAICWETWGAHALSFGTSSLGLACAALLAIAWNFEDKDRLEQRMRRRQARLNRRLPWRPMQGEAHPADRDDHWPRWLVTVNARDEHFEVGLQRWYTVGDQHIWQRDEYEQQATVALDDTAALGDARALAQEERDRRNADEQQRWMTEQSEQMEASKIAALAAAAADEQAARRAHDRQLAEALSD